MTRVPALFRHGRAGTRWRYWFVALLCAFALSVVRQAVAQEEGALAAHYLSVRSNPGQPFGQDFRSLIEEAGSRVGRVVDVPAEAGGGQIASVLKPADPARAKSLASRLRSVVRDGFVEGDSCREYLPQEPFPGQPEWKGLGEGASGATLEQVLGALPAMPGGADARVLVAPDPPSVSDFVSGLSVPWVSDPPLFAPASRAPGLRVGRTVVRGGWRVIVAEGWDSTTTTPPETPPEEPGITPPITETYTQACDLPGRTPAPTPAIKVALKAGEPATFPYPRPIPLQAIARDYDQIRHTCSGCSGGKSDDIRYIEDAISTYRWEITGGEGSLNSPYVDIEDLEELERKIREKREEIREKAQELARLKEQRKQLQESRKARREALQAEIEKLKKERTEVESEKTEVLAEIAARHEQLAQLEAELRAALEAIEQKRAEIKEKQARIDELQDKIDGEPSGREKTLSAKIDDLEKRTEALRAELEQLRQGHAFEEDQLRQSYNRAVEKLVAARRALQQTRARLRGVQDRISALQNSLYTSPQVQDVLLRKAGMQDLGRRISSRYLSGRDTGLTKLSQFADAFVRAPTAAARQSALDSFLAQKADILSSLEQQCGALSGADRSACLDDLRELRGETDSLGETMQRSASTPAIDPQKWKDLQKQQADLAALENQAKAAGAKVEAAQREVNAAQQRYLDGLDRLEQAESRMLEQIAQLEQQSQDLSGELEKEHRRAEEERVRNTPQWLDEIATLRAEIDELSAQISGKHREASAKQARRLEVDKELLGLEARRKELDNRLSYIDARIRDREEKIRKLDTEDDELARKIAKAKDELARLEKELEELEKGRNPRAHEKKSATGQQVFYIPPPLELVPGFNKGRFDQLKEEVARAEAQLEKARGAKAGLQDKAWEILRGMNENLWTLRAALDTIASVEEELKELEDEQHERKTELAHQRSGEAEKANQRLAEAEGKLEDARGKEGAAERSVEFFKKEVSNKRKEFDKEFDALVEVEVDAAGLRDEATARRKELAKVRAELARKRTDVESVLSRMRDAEERLARARDSLSRAAARENEQAERAARAEVDRYQSQLDKLKQDFTARRAELASLRDRFEQAQKASRDADKASDRENEKLRAQRRRFSVVEQQLKYKIKLYDGAVEDKLAARREVKRAEKALEDQKEQTRKANEATQKVDEDPDVKEAQKAIDAKNKDKEKAEADKKKAEVALENLQKAREEWKQARSRADAEIDKARKALDDARQAMKRFLEKEFDKVNFTVTLRLTVEDQPIGDKWRSDDKAVQKVITISFKGRREPVIKGPDDDLRPPPPSHKAASCDVKFSYLSEPAPRVEVVSPPAPAGIEPQTIALFYKQGQPLYHRWPPRKENTDILVASATRFATAGIDTDKTSVQCVAGSGKGLLVGGGVPAPAAASGPMCAAGKPAGGEVSDVVHAVWTAPAHTSPTELRTMLDIPEVSPEQCSGKETVKVLYHDSKLQFNDGADKRLKYERLTGLLGDAPAVYTDFGRDNRVELRVQVFDGAHKGKPGQTIEWKVSSHQPAELKDDEYGFEANKSKSETRTTDAAGYSRINFYLTARYGDVDINATWKRGKDTCTVAKIKVRRLLELRKLYVGFAPDKGWEQARKMWDGDNDSEGLAKALPEDGADQKPTFAVGLLDDQKSAVDGKKILFSALEPPEAGMEPAEKETEIYGLAWSFASDIEKEAQLKMKAGIDDPLKPVTRPPEVEGEQSTETENRFLIGPEGKYLTIETDKPFVPGQPYTGGARFVIAGGIPVKFKKLQLQAESVTVERKAAGLVATAGTVSWSTSAGGGKPFSFEKANFNFVLETLGLTAGADGRLSGKVKLPGMEEEAGFSAIIGPGGFLGEANNFPELKFGGVTLEKGAAVLVDMHDSEGPEDVSGWSGRGLLIRQAKLVLPDSMKGERDKPPVIGVKDLFFNSAGLSGEISIEYSVSANLGKVELAVEKVLVEFRQNELTRGEFEGKATFADPFQGGVGLKVALSRDGTYSIEGTTNNPVTAPSLGLTFQIKKLKGAYEDKKKIFEFTLSALLKSETFTDVSIDGFVIKSNGDVKADAIKIEEEVKFGPGFSATLNQLAFKKTSTEFEVEVKAGFTFTKRLVARDAEFKIVTGPRVEKLAFSLEGGQTPVSFNIDVTYQSDLLSGSGKLKVEKLLDIDATLVVGAQKDAGGEAFSFWYTELSSKVALPLGQTGLQVNRIGGGAGYNYDPPVGAASGAARRTDSMAFKALIGVGNVPNGEVFSGRLTMVLADRYFILNGKVWVLAREESLYGEGQLGMYWDNPARLEGFLRMLVALPDAEGGLMRFNGQVDFRFAGGNDWYVKSKTLEGTVLERVIAEGSIDVRQGLALLDGNIRYDLSKTVPLAVVKLHVEVHLRADGKLEFRVTPVAVTLDTRLGFRGSLDLNVEAVGKTFNIGAASLETLLTLNASNRSIEVRGSAAVSWKTWVHSGSTRVDIGYSM